MFIILSIQLPWFWRLRWFWWEITSMISAPWSPNKACLISRRPSPLLHLLWSLPSIWHTCHVLSCPVLLDSTFSVTWILMYFFVIIYHQFHSDSLQFIVKTPKKLLWVVQTRRSQEEDVEKGGMPEKESPKPAPLVLEWLSLLSFQEGHPLYRQPHIEQTTKITEYL